jgi:lipoprotein signal peptidase
MVELPRATKGLDLKNSLLQFKILISLVAIDTVSKLMAFSFLPPNQIPNPSAVLQLVLTVNYVGIGTYGKNVIASGGNNMASLAPIFTLLLGVFLLIVGYWRRLSSVAVAFCIGMALLVSFIVLLVLPSSTQVFANSILPLRAAQCFLWIVIWILVSHKIWKLGALLFVSAAIGNFLSSFYPPYYIVDFIWSAPFSRLTGMGIFNFADTFWDVGVIVFLFAFVFSIAGFFRKRSRSTPVIDDVDP